MIGQLALKALRRLGAFILHDEVRLLELFSALNLLAWVKVLHENPFLFQRDSYLTFASLGQPIWLALFAIVAAVQVAGMLMGWRYAHEVRLVGFALASGVWASVTISFIYSGVSTTAELNYSLLALGCMISGAFVGWKAR